MPTDSALIGRTLAGRYTITGHIGAGGFATVYRGVQEDGEPRDVAIKVMNQELAANRTLVRRFRREAEAAVRLHHPCIVRVLEYGVDAGVLFIAMELLVGQDLFDALQRERRLPESRAVRLVAQVCDALAAAHDIGIVHRNLKPENVRIVADSAAEGGERVKVLDFGIAKILESDPEERPSRVPDDDPPSSTRSALTRAGTAMGTPAYMSPEQGRAETIDARSDLYACGVLLYQLVTGRLPFDGETPLQIIMQHVHERPRPPSELVPGLHRGLEATILRALSKYPSERQKNARDLRDDLLGALPSLATGRHKSLAPPPSVILSSAPQSPPLVVLGQGTPAVPTPVTPSSDSTRTMIRDAAAQPAPEPRAAPPPHHEDTAPTPLVIDVERAAVPEPPLASSQPGPTGVSTLRSRIQDVTPFVGTLVAAPPPEPPRARLPPPLAVALGLVLGLICFALIALAAVLIAR